MRNSSTTMTTSMAPSRNAAVRLSRERSNEVRLPENLPVDLHAWREGALDVIQRGIECSGQLQRVRARLFLDAEDDCRLGVVGSFAALECLADPHLAQVAHQNGTARLAP